MTIINICNYHILTRCSSLNITIQPQDIAIPSSNITSDSDGRPVLSFYAQLDSERVVSSDVLMRAVEVRFTSWIQKIFGPPFLAVALSLATLALAYAEP